MLVRVLFPSASKRNPSFTGFVLLASFLAGICPLTVRTAQADQPSRAHVLKFDDPEPSSDDEDSSGESEDSEKPGTVKTASNEEVVSGPDGMPQPVTVNSIGSFGRASYLGGKTFGRTTSITPVELVPYLLLDEHFVFSDLRGFVSNYSQLGGNAGVGYRRLLDDWNAWAGASVWYDADHTTPKLFQQVGLSLEALVQQFEFRSNIYIPFGSSQSSSNVISNPQIVGNQLLYSRSVTNSGALTGFDGEVGYSMPIQNKHVLRGFLGGYHFEGSSHNVNGFKARMEGVINNAVIGQLLYTHDNLYGDYLMVGVSVQFPMGRNHPTAGWTRNTPSPFRYVERNYNVIVAQSQGDADNQVATDPTTGKPYFIEQVSSLGGGGGTPDGTTSNPFPTIAAAQAAGGNVILVQSGSVFTQPVVLSAGQHLLGQGSFDVSLPTVGGGSVPIPQAPSGSMTPPVFQNVTGPVVTLASNTDFGGFNISGVTGNAIVGSNIGGVSVHDLAFSSIGGDAINLANTSGSVAISNIQVSSASGNGIVFNGGSPDLVFNGGAGVISAQGNGFVLENLTGGSIALNGLTLANLGGSGLVMDSVSAPATIDSLTVSQSGASGSAVAISGTTATTQTVNGTPTTVYGNYSFTGNTNIATSNGSGFSVSNSDASIGVANLNVTSAASAPAVLLSHASNTITIQDLTLNTQNAMGLSAVNVTNLTVNSGSITTVNAPAVDVETSTIHSLLNYVSVTGGPYGIKLNNGAGEFTIQGSGGYGSGGTISGTTNGLLINSFGTTALYGVNFYNNQTAIQSTGSSTLFLYDVIVTGSPGYALDSLDDATLTLSNSIFATDGAVGGGTIRIQANTGGLFTQTIQNNTITDSNGTALQLATQSGGANASLVTAITGNTISGYHSGSQVIGMDWNGPVSATVSSNTLLAYNSNMTAMLLQNSSLSAAFVPTVASNVIYFQGPSASNGTGIWMIAGQSGQTVTGTATTNVTSNVVQFTGTGGTGMRFGFYGPSSDTITSNTITDLAGGATGMLFDNAAANGSAELIGNKINLVSGDPLTHRGIIFSQAASNFTLVTPNNTVSNWVYNATSAQNQFSIPAGTGAGGILINNIFLQAPGW